MVREAIQHHSSYLDKNVDLIVYGHYGFSIVLFPAFSDDCGESETEGLIEAIAPFINNGTCRVYALSGFLFNTWLDGSMKPEEKSKFHYQYNQFIEQELVPFIYYNNGGAVPIFTCGASNGAYLAANTYFRRPDIFLGTIAMSGKYNISHYSKDFFDDNCYFNSPSLFLVNLNDPYWLAFLRSRHHVYIMSGSGEGEQPHHTYDLAGILASKEIPHQMCVWGPEYCHNYETWKKMLAQILREKF
jgi:esterase/lipase superfamily enzyme